LQGNGRRWAHSKCHQGRLKKPGMARQLSPNCKRGGVVEPNQFLGETRRGGRTRPRRGSELRRPRERGRAGLAVEGLFHLSGGEGKRGGTEPMKGGGKWEKTQPLQKGKGGDCSTPHCPLKAVESRGGENPSAPLKEWIFPRANKLKERKFSKSFSEGGGFPTNGETQWSSLIREESSESNNQVDIDMIIKGEKKLTPGRIFFQGGDRENLGQNMRGQGGKEKASDGRRSTVW